MMTRYRAFLGSLLFAASVSLQAAADVVVLKGGARIDLQKPPAQQGNVVLLTRADGTLLSVPVTEIDWKATEAARSERAARRSPEPAVTAPPETPAQAARVARERPKARVKVTDSDVQHVASEGPAEEKDTKGGEQRAGAARLEVADYAQEKTGANLVVRGEVRNSGATAALNSRMTVTAMDEKGEKIASGEAGLANSLVAPGAIVSFSATIPVGEKLVASLRFAPQWVAPAAPAPGSAPTPAPAAAPARPAPTSPAPQPTPYGQGNLYAPPAAAAPTAPPADNNRGYIPGMSSPENQPKPPK